MLAAQKKCNLIQQKLIVRLQQYRFTAQRPSKANNALQTAHFG